MNVLYIVLGVVLLFIAVFVISLRVSNRKTKQAATSKEKQKQLEDAAKAGERQDAQERKARGTLLARLQRIARKLPNTDTEGSS